MKVKMEMNPEFDFVCGYIGGFDDIPTKQDKFKPLTQKTLYYKDDEGNEQVLEGEFYASNNKAKENIKAFETKFIDSFKERLTEEHPYKLEVPIEIYLTIRMSEKRLKSVDLDNLAKCALDVMKGLIFEDDSQIIGLIVFKGVIKDEIVPQLSGLTVGVRLLNKRNSLLSGLTFHNFYEISDEEYEQSNSESE